jgi:ketosteroid isomerase-like protein
MADMADMAGVDDAVEVRLRDAINAHDLDRMVSLFAPDYDSTFPAHPDRAFSGPNQVRDNWSRIFGSVPDLSARLVRAAESGNTIWTEWDWAGTRADGVAYHMRGVVIMGLRDRRIAWARLYMEPVEEGGAGIDAAVQRLTGHPQS